VAKQELTTAIMSRKSP